MLGAIYGDVLGSTREFSEKKYKDLSEIQLFQAESHTTDDSVLTCTTDDWLLNEQLQT